MRQMPCGGQTILSAMLPLAIRPGLLAFAIDKDVLWHCEMALTTLRANRFRHAVESFYSEPMARRYSRSQMFYACSIQTGDDANRLLIRTVTKLRNLLRKGSRAIPTAVLRRGLLTSNHASPARVGGGVQDATDCATNAANEWELQRQFLAMALASA